MMLAKARPASG